MFYSQFILAKKGPLGTIWIAAHLERKLRKNQITETNISASVDSILFPEVPIALRLSGHLLLGVVRIYSRKVNYLFHDCSEALIKIKHAFHSSAVDLPPESSTAPFHSITLPETFDFDELEVFLKRDKGIPAAVRGIVDHNVSERDLITLREQDAQACRSSLFTLDERFPENCDPYSLLDYHDEQHVRDELQNCTGSASASLMQENCGPSLEEDVLPPLQMDDEMDFEKTNIDEAAVFQEMVLDEVATPLMHTNLQDTLIPEPGAEQLHSPSKDAHVANGSMSVTEMLQIPDVERLRSVVEPQEHEPFFMELDDELGHKNDAVDLAEHKEGNAADDLGTHVEEPTPVLKETPVSSRPSPLTAETYTDFHGSDDLLATILGGRTPALKMIGTPSEVVASVKEKRGQRKRKHVLDDSVALSSMIMKKQLTDTADLCRKRRRTPLTKFQARKMQGSYNDEKFAIPSFPGLCIDIKELYSSVVSLSSSKPVVKPSPHKLGNAKACEGFQEEAFSEAAEPNDLYNGMMENNATPEPLRADFQEVLQAAEPFPNATLSDGLFEQASENLTFLADSNETLQAAAEPLPNSASSEDLSEQALKNQTFLGDSEDRDSQEKALGAAERLPKTASAEDLSEQGLETATFPAGSKDALQAAEPLPNAASSEDVCEQALENLTFLADSKDKVFLAADEEANLEETDVNYHRKGKTVQDKSGWSLRTKAVAEYLKPLFEKLESTPVLDAGPSKLSLDSLLKRRSRKEAARMFFEILVLKSKEYIHVDQSTGFADIMLSSTHLLRKEVF